MEGNSIKSNKQPKRFSSLGLSNQRRIWTNISSNRKNWDRSKQNSWISNGDCCYNFVNRLIYIYISYNIIRAGSSIFLPGAKYLYKISTLHYTTVILVYRLLLKLKLLFGNLALPLLDPALNIIRLYINHVQ
jgi:hypothetical protein